jgi:hypothetical protein
MGKIELEMDDYKYLVFEKIIKSANKSDKDILSNLVEKTLDSNNIDWFYTSIKGVNFSKSIQKIKVIDMFREEKIFIDNNKLITFATKNNDNKTYWLNPNKYKLNDDWYIILNDPTIHKLMLFFIPKNNEDKYKFKCRADTPEKLDIQISYNDEDFIDYKSGVKFNKYLVKEIYYETLT